jgi:hypothetical protein
MSKKKSANAATSWVPSEFEQSDLTKAQKEGFLVGGDQVIFPSTERIPKPPSGYRVMFLAFLLRGLSLPTHKFLRGLLFVCGVQLHQLTPNSVEAHYLEFNMATSVQGWRKKWFYIKDQKTSSSDHYSIAPFDADKDLTKLSSWDSPPTEAETEDIKPLLARIQSLKSATGGALSGTQLLTFFLQRRIPPLQHRISKLWSYSGSKNPSRVSKEDIDKKDLDKRVRALTTLTKDDEIPALAADFFDSTHSLPTVCALQFINF